MDLGKGFSGIIDDAGFLDEIVYAERGEEFCGSVGRKYMVWSREIIAERFTAVFAKEDSTCIFYPCHGGSDSAAGGAYGDDDQ